MCDSRQIIKLLIKGDSELDLAWKWFNVCMISNALIQKQTNTNDCWGNRIIQTGLLVLESPGHNWVGVVGPGDEVPPSIAKVSVQR